MKQVLGKFYPILLLLCLYTLNINAQRSIEGYVRDSSGQALEFANVIAFSGFTRQAISFARTDERGFYALSLSPDSNAVVLKIILLGYQSAEEKIAFTASAPPKLQKNIILHAAVTALREVVVRERATPIRQRSDTTEWRVASFSDSTEVSVEDLLRKLPGVEVNEQGDIKVNGKSVEKILIEGDDLFGRDYTLASRNIRAANLETVQAIDRHQDNPVLAGIKSSDALVLNLTLRKDVKRVLSGNFTAGSGWGKEYKYYLHGNLFSFTKRGKTFLFGNLNNAGFDALRDAEFFMSGEGLESAAENVTAELPNKTQLTLPEPQSIGLPEAITRPDRIGLITLNQLTTFSPS